MMDIIDLTRKLIAFDTTNPPGREAECGEFIASLLGNMGFSVQRYPFDDNRLNLTAALPGRDVDLPPLVLTGHIDTVPLGAAPWSVDPFAGVIKDGRLYGRGVSDMKAGVAAMIVAASRIAKQAGALHRGLILVFTSGEETGCAGALQLAAAGVLGRASAMIVGEPTGNRISTGHKGCMAVRARAAGITAHSSMPDKGVNAIYAAARAILRAESYQLDRQQDPLLGEPTINVGMISGGLNYNSVPDAAEFTVDVRSTAQMNHDAIQAGLADVLGHDIELERFVDMPPVSTAESDSFIRLAQGVLREVCGADTDVTPVGIPFFSDASVFHPHYGCPTLILGPGEPGMAHQTDEYCFVEKMHTSVELYMGIASKWCEG